MALTLTGGAAAWIHLLACRVGVSERSVLPETVAPLAAALIVVTAGLVFAAIARREKKHPGTFGLVLRDLIPALVLAPIAIHASIAETPTFGEVVLAPLLTGLAAARVAERLLPEGRGPGRIVPRALVRHASLVVLAFAVVMGLAFYVHACGLLDDLGLGFSDVGDYGVRIENTLRGRFMKSFVSPGLPPFFDHWNPGLLVLVPLDAALRGLLPGARFLQAVQAVALAACAPLAYGLARRRLHDPPTAALVALSFVLAPAFTHLNVAYSYGFHPVTLALVALLAACHAFAARRVKTAALLLVVAWSFEETVAIATFGAGVALGLSRDTRRQGAALAFASVVYFLLATRVVMPLVNGAPYYQLSKYAHLGGSMGAIAAAPFLRPGVFWGTLLDRASLGFVATLLAPWLLLPATRPRWLLATAPILVFACLRDEPHVKSIVLQYQTTILPWLLVGLVEALRGRHRAERRRRRALALGVLVAAIGSALLYGDAPFGRARRPWARREGRGADLAAIEAAIAPAESISATQRIAARFLGSHPEVAIVRDELLPPADVFVIDLDDSWGLVRTTRAHRHVRDLRAQGYRTRIARRELVVLARGGEATPPRSAEPPSGEPGVPVSLVSRTEKDGRLLLRWRLERRTSADLGAIPLGADGRVCGEVLPVGSTDRPTYEREPGEVFDEERSAFAPVKDFLFFDYLDLDRRGLDVVDALPPG